LHVSVAVFSGTIKVFFSGKVGSAIPLPRIKLAQTFAYACRPTKTVKIVNSYRQFNVKIITVKK